MDRAEREGQALADAGKQFLVEMASRGLSEASCLLYHGALLCLFRHLERRKVRAVEQVRPTDMYRWLEFVKHGMHPRRGQASSRYAPRTIHHYVLTVRRFFEWLVERGVLLVNPARELSVRDLPIDPVGRLQIPSEHMMRDVLGRLARETPLQIRDHAALELVYSSGLRIGEVRRLDLMDADLTEHVVRIWQSKGRKDRVVPLGRPAAKALAEYLDVARPQLAVNRTEQALFLTAGGHRLGATTLVCRIKKLSRQLGFPRFRIHDLRHASALHMLLHGADLRHLKEFLGHSGVKATQVYTRLAPADLKKAHQHAHPRERHKE